MPTAGTDRWARAGWELGYRTAIFREGRARRRLGSGGNDVGRIPNTASAPPWLLPNSSSLRFQCSVGLLYIPGSSEISTTHRISQVISQISGNGSSPNTIRRSYPVPICPLVLKTRYRPGWSRKHPEFLSPTTPVGKHLEPADQTQNTQLANSNLTLIKTWALVISMNLDILYFYLLNLATILLLMDLKCVWERKREENQEHNLKSLRYPSKKNHFKKGEISYNTF